MSKPLQVPFAATLHVRDTCLCLHAQRAARALARRFDQALARFEITSGQFSLLMSLNRPQAPGMAPVAELLAMDRTTLTAALKPLQRRGLVEVEVDADDRRGRRLKLTLAGGALLAKAVPIWKREHADLDRRMQNLDSLRRDLKALNVASPLP